VTWYREWFGEEYLELYSYRDEEEARRQVAFVSGHVGPIEGTVLDLACGSGRHLQELRAAGYRSLGCDLSYVLLRTALREDGRHRVTRADMRELPFRDGTFGGLVNFFTSFGYFSEEEDNLRVVDEMSRVLAPGAPFVFDYLNVQREIANMVAHEEREIDSEKVIIHRWFDAAGHSFNKRITIGAKRFLERVRAYDLAEIRMMFGAAGLTIHRVYGDFEGGECSPSSPRVIAIGSKNG
jgi:SAM-dependent methyltransferase